MKYSEIKDLQVAELNKRLEQNKQALFDARMKHKMQRLSNAMELRDLKKDIARLQTALSILPESAFVSEKKETIQKEPKKTVEAKKVAKVKVAKTKEMEKPATADKPSAEKIKKPVEVAAKGKGSDKSQKDSKVQKSEKQAKWFNFLGGKSTASKSGKSAPGKRKLFRRKSG